MFCLLKRRVLPLFISTIGFVSCRTIQAVNPILSTVEPNIPKIGPSTINIPVEIDLTDKLRQVEESIPRTFEGKEEPCEGVRYAYKFIRKPIEFSYHNTHIGYSIDGKFELKLNYCAKCYNAANKSCLFPLIPASCGVNEPMRRMSLSYETKVEISPRFQLEAQTKLKRFQIMDPCEISVFNYDVTNELEREMKKELISLEKSIDKEIESVDLYSSIDGVWKSLEDPISLSNYGFLYLRPQQLSLSPISFHQDNKVGLSVGLTAEPFISTEKELFSPVPLPALRPYTPSEGFNIHTYVKASYDSISSIMNQYVGGYKFSYRHKTCVLDSIQIIGKEKERLVMRIFFSGTKRGWFYLWGEPKITAENMLILTNIEYDLASKSLLLHAAKWLFDERILAYLNEGLKYDLSPLVDAIKNQINYQINSELDLGVFLSGTTKEISLKNILLAVSGLYVECHVGGNMKLNLK